MAESVTRRVREALRRTAFSYTDTRRVVVAVAAAAVVVAIVVAIAVGRSCVPSKSFEVTGAAEEGISSASDGTDAASGDGGAVASSAGVSASSGSIASGTASAGASGATLPATLRVHVTGAVANPGVYDLASGARVVDAIEAAGGMAEDASEDALNRACPVADGQQVYLPTDAEVEAGRTVTGVDVAQLVGSACSASVTSAAGAISSSGSSTATSSSLVNINTASQTELETLPGVGPVTAQAIISYRETNGGFQEVSDLRDVNGIGDKKYAQLVDYVCV